MAEKVVLKILTMSNDKTRQKAMETAADIDGVDSMAADLKEKQLTVIGSMDTAALVKGMKKLGKVEVVSVGPAQDDQK